VPQTTHPHGLHGPRGYSGPDREGILTPDYPGAARSPRTQYRLCDYRLCDHPDPHGPRGLRKR